MDFIGSIISNGLGALFAIPFILAILFGSIAQAADNGGWKTENFWYVTVPCYAASLFIAATIGKVFG